MVKKSILGRLFGKKNTDATKDASGGKTPAMSKSATATLPKKDSKDAKGGTFTNRVKTAVKNGRFGGGRNADGKNGGQKDKPDLTSERPIMTSERATIVSKPDDSSKDAKAESRKPEPKLPEPKLVEPEILTRTAQAATESREKIDVIAKKMSAQEEVTIKMSDGIKGISGILSNIDQRLDEQNKQSTELVRSVKNIPEMMKDLPESSRAGVELLQAISQVLENQSQATAKLGEQLAGIPGTLNKLNERIDTEAQHRAKEREALTSNFDSSVKTMKSSLGELEKRQVSLAKVQVDNTKKLVTSLKSIQEAQNSQIGRLIEKNRMTNRLMAVLVFVVVVLLVAFLATL